MWFLVLAASYIDLGIEAIQFGQVEIMDEQDKDHAHWRDLLSRVRAYATLHARRHFVLCDAHVPSGGIVHGERLLLDFHSFPLRIAEVSEKPQEGFLKMGHLDSIYGRSKGGLTPSGWSCPHLPYLVELDNYGVSARPGQPGTAYFTWGYDEISWFAHQPEHYRNEWLRYAWNWLREKDPNGWLQMPGSRTLHAPVGGRHWYWANTRSAATPEGFNQEETIKAIWAEGTAGAANAKELPSLAGLQDGETDLFSRSVVSTGHGARLARILAKARRGEAVTVGVIGGSITAGAGATLPERRYGDSVAAWWRRTFSQANVRFVNAGIGATGSDYGALRAKRDLLSHNPDFIVVEYAVNDPNTQAAAETLEGLLRQILGAPNQPAVLLLFTMHQDGGNAQEWHAKVGRHYDLPMVSFRDALWPEIKQGRMKWSDIEADTVHPNDRGHDYCARFITRLLDRVLADLPADNQVAPLKPMPQPLFSDVFEHVALFEADALKPLANQGWRCETGPAGDKYWKADQPGSVIAFELAGQILLLMDWHIRGPMGQASVRVDEQTPLIRDGWFDQTWGGYRQTTVVARELGPNKHQVRIELLQEKHSQSTGHEFRVLGLGAAGVKAGN
jgi:lysophospholipase L1-like esterase